MHLIMMNMKDPFSLKNFSKLDGKFDFINLCEVLSIFKNQK